MHTHTHAHTHTAYVCVHIAPAANPNWAPVVSLGSGAFAGAAGTIASYPFDLIRTTLAAQGEPKVRRALTNMRCYDQARAVIGNKHTLS